MGRPPCCDKSNVKRGLWTAEEDAKILAYVANHGIGNWTLVPQKAGLNRCGKSCRLRWTNYLRPDLRHDAFTQEEEQLIIDCHQAVGSSQTTSGRTDNDVKNYWNTKLKKKLSKMGIDPVTHKSYSQIFSDYGRIFGLPNTTSQIQPLTNSMDNLSTFTSDQSVANANMYSSWENLAQYHKTNPETIQHQLNGEVNPFPIPSSSSPSSSSSCTVNQSPPSPSKKRSNDSMATTLQRSSVSFRRQGSSGRIWSDRMQAQDRKPGGHHAAVAFETSQQENFRPDSATDALPPSDSRSPADPSPTDPPESESKPQRCAFSSIFRRCMRSGSG
ncbi:hypothetical protein NMG60_11028376 [Bertholletia excelsa]